MDGEERAAVLVCPLFEFYYFFKISKLLLKLPLLRIWILIQKYTKNTKDWKFIVGAYFVTVIDKITIFHLKMTSPLKRNLKEIFPAMPEMLEPPKKKRLALEQRMTRYPSIPRPPPVVVPLWSPAQEDYPAWFERHWSLKNLRPSVSTSQGLEEMQELMSDLLRVIDGVQDLQGRLNEDWMQTNKFVSFAEGLIELKAWSLPLAQHVNSLLRMIEGPPSPLPTTLGELQERAIGWRRDW